MFKTLAKPELPLNKTTEVSPRDQAFVGNLMRLGLLTMGQVSDYFSQNKAHLPDLASAMVRAGYLTDYQLGRIAAGSTHGLILGNYKVLNRLGSGAAGVVFRAEHMSLKRQAAVKVMPLDEEDEEDLGSRIKLERFYAEMRVLATIHHPHIVMAYDGGQVPSPSPETAALLYLAMELVDGCDLEQYVMIHGPAPIAKASAWIRQAALGLKEAHDHQLIHRDIKPSNLLLDKQEQIKIADFGLVRQPGSQLTVRGSLLGTAEFMAPEQSIDASNVGAAADIYSLGATFYWLLTGKSPGPETTDLFHFLQALRYESPKPARCFRPEVPADLETLLEQMLQRDPRNRPESALAVSQRLVPFCD
jgi:serine/threonine protein kinase